MKTFNQFILEAFDKPYPVKLKKVDSLEYVSKTKLPDGSNLNIEFTGVEFDDIQWNIVFFRGGSIEKTGEGDEMKIFATVISATEKFLKKVKPNYVSFTADKSMGVSRTSLYSKLLKRYASKWGYKTTTDKSSSSSDVFHMEKK